MQLVALVNDHTCHGLAPLQLTVQGQVPWKHAGFAFLDTLSLFKLQNGVSSQTQYIYTTKICELPFETILLS